MDAFEVFSTCLKGKRASEEDINNMNTWLFARWLSGDPRVVHIANSLNAYYNMPALAQYELARGLLHDKIKFIRFPKISKQKNMELADIIIERYRCSPALVPEILSLMSEEEVQYLKRLGGQ